MGYNIPEMERLNFSSNLGSLLENRTFKDDKDLKNYIIEYFKNINFLNHRRINEVIIFKLSGLGDILLDIKLDSYFLTYCEVEEPGDLDIKNIVFDKADFIEYINDYDPLKDSIVLTHPIILNDIDYLPI